MPWPQLSEARDGPTIAALHLYSQILGKAAVALLPWRNHGWHVTLHVHPSGLRTEPLYGAGGPVELGLDLTDHEFTFVDGAVVRRVPLRPLWGSSSSPMRRCARPATRIRRCWPSSKELTSPQRISADGTVWPWNARRAFRRCRGPSEILPPAWG